MKIAVMMRTIDQDGGLHVYVERLVDGMVRLDPDTRFLLLYRTRKWLGRFASHANVLERLVHAPHKLLWDQVSVPLVAWREHADIIFNPKFSVPFVSHCRVAMSLREPAWWVWRQHYPAWNALFMRVMIPLYARRAAVLFPITSFVLQENARFLRVPPSKIVVAHPAPNRHFQPVTDGAVRDRVRRHYGLPERFVLGAARVAHPGIEETKAFFPGKNVETTVRAFALCRDRIPHDLVLAGARIRDYLRFRGVPDADLARVHILDAVAHDDMAALYSMADVFVLPSFYEGFGQALVEAMACGCPVVASRAGSCPEVSGGAALLADPHSPEEFAERIYQVLSDPALQARLQRAGLERAAWFSWERTSRLVLEALKRAASRQEPVATPT